MPEQRSDNSDPPKTLREQAEHALRTTRTDISAMAADDVQQLVHELQVHQIELEMQNDELQNALGELERTRDRYVNLYDFAPVGYLTLNSDGVIRAANLTAASILGTPRQRLVGQKFAMSLTVDDRDALHQHLRQLTETKERLSCRLAVNTTTGASTTIHLDSMAHRDADELQLRVTLSDVTQTRLLEEALQEKTRQLRWTDALPMLLCYLDTELRYQYCNTAHAEWFGTAPENLKGKPLRDTIPEKLYAQFEDYLADALLGREITFELTVEHEQHGPRELQSLFVPDCGADGAVIGVHGLCLDVTDRKLMETQATRRRRFEERLDGLSTDERDVYELIVRGESNKSVAHQLDIGLRTAERRRQIVLEKSGVESLAELLQELVDIRTIGTTSPPGTSKGVQH